MAYVNCFEEGEKKTSTFAKRYFSFFFSPIVG
jgi:hypothetical protein